MFGGKPLDAPVQRALALLTLVLAWGCRDSGAPRPLVPLRPAPQLLDAGHGAGNPHFYFLPPLVAAPSPTGAFDGSVAPFTAVEICEWTGSACVLPLLARFTTTSGPGSETIRVSIDDEQYIVNWHTDECALSMDKIYRIRVLVAGAELGHADLDVVASGKDLRRVDTGEYVGLVDGRTLPIKFRVEQGAVFVLGSGASTVSAADGALTLVVPGSALPGPTGLVVRPAGAVPPDAGLVPGTAYELDPDSLSFATPATLTIGYRPADVSPGVDEGSLRLHRAAGPAWIEVFDGRVSLDSHSAGGSIDRLGVYAVLTQRPVASVSVTPLAAQIKVGESLQLRATPRDALGNALARAVEWTSDAPAAAVVDVSGRVTGVASGAATIAAVSGGIPGSATITVVNPAYPNEPAGFTRLTERGFAAREENGWRTTTSENFQIVEDPTAPKSPPYVGEMQFPTGFVGGDTPAWTEIGDISDLGYRRLYLSFWVKLSDNWQGHDSYVNKIMYVWQHHNAVFFAHVLGKDDGPLTTRLGLQEIPIVLASNLEPNLANVAIVRGQWQRWEILLISNTGDNTDGEAHWWIDGVKVGEYRDVMYRTSAQSDVWEHITWYPVWGGVGDAVAETMSMRMDHFYASGGP